MSNIATYFLILYCINFVCFVEYHLPSFKAGDMLNKCLTLNLARFWIVMFFPRGQCVSMKTQESTLSYSFLLRVMYLLDE